jgi:surfeit locus 1 family protein
VNTKSPTSNGVSFQPGLWPTLIAVPAILVLLGLGAWQVQRLAWKQALIDTVEAQLAAAPVALPSNVGDPQDWLYRRVTLSGHFHHDHEIHLLAQTKRGNLGYQIITPLERPDGSFVLVNRGWVPTERKDPASRPEGLVEGEVSIEGIVRLPWKQGLFIPDNDPAANIWFYGDLAAMAKQAGVAAPEFMVEAGPAPNPGGFPIGGQTRVTFRNDHLQYALTWFALAVALAVIFYLFGRRKPNTEP